MPPEDLLICKTLLERIDTSVIRIEERVNYHGIMIAKMQTWLLIIGFLAGVIIPSIWSLVFANIVEAPLAVELSRLLSLIHSI